MTAPDPRLGEIEGRLSKATPGPWEEYWQGHIHAPANYPQAAATSICQTYGREDRRHPNAEFIAAAPADVTYLLAELRKAQGKAADVLAIADIGMNSKHGDPAFIQGWECAIEEIKARIESGDES